MSSGEDQYLFREAQLCVDFKDVEYCQGNCQYLGDKCTFSKVIIKSKPQDKVGDSAIIQFAVLLQ